MKKVTAGENVFGPFKQVSVLSAALLCDGSTFPFTVIGEYIISDVEEGDFPPFTVSVDREALSTAIDSAVIAIYSRPTALAEEYKLREAGAVAYKSAEYTGVVPARVAAFAVSAGMTAEAATNLILAQSQQFRAALGQLSDLRMQKYAVMRAETDLDAKNLYDSVMTDIAAIAAALS